MLKQRRDAATAVAHDFLAAERAVEAAAEHAAKCIGTMVEQRAKANLPLDIGAEALVLLAEGLNDMLAARRKVFEAHRHLAALPAALRMPPMAFGDTGCPDEALEPSGARRLTVVA